MVSVTCVRSRAEAKDRLLARNREMSEKRLTSFTVLPSRSMGLAGR